MNPVDPTSPQDEEGAAASCDEDRILGTTLVRRMLVYAPSTVIPAGLLLVTSIVFTRIFPPADYGIYTLMLVLATSIRLLFTTWLVQGIGRFLPRAEPGRPRDNVRDAIFLATSATFLAEAILGLTAIVAVRSALPVGWTAVLPPVLVFLLTTSVFDVLIAAFAAEARAKEYVSYKLVDSIATFALRLLLVSSIFSMDIRLMFLSVSLGHLVLLPIMWFRAGLRSPLKLRWASASRSTRGTAKALLAYGMPMTLWYVSLILLDVSDRYVINFFLGTGPVGIYDANYRLMVGLATLLIVPVTTTLHPYLMKISAGEEADRSGEVIGLVIENLLIVGTLATGLAIVLHGDVARILLGRDFREGSIVMAPVLAGVFLGNIGTFTHKPFEMIGKTSIMVISGFSAAATNIAVCFLLIPLVGYIGAAYSTFLSFLFYAVTTGLLGRRIIPWRIGVRKVSAYSAAIVGGLTVIHGSRWALEGALPYSWELAATVVACCALTLGVLGVLLRPRGQRDAVLSDGRQP